MNCVASQVRKALRGRVLGLEIEFKNRFGVQKSSRVRQQFSRAVWPSYDAFREVLIMRSAGNGFHPFSQVHSRAPSLHARAGGIKERERREICISHPFQPVFFSFSAASSPRREVQLPAAPIPVRDQREQLEFKFPAAMSRGKCFLLSPCVPSLFDDAWKRLSAFPAYYVMCVCLYDAMIMI